ncbi:hypothetical protein ABFV05_020475 [Capra hircus]
MGNCRPVDDVLNRTQIRLDLCSDQTHGSDGTLLFQKNEIVRPDVNTGAGRQGPGGQKAVPLAAPRTGAGIGDAQRSGK